MFHELGQVAKSFLGGEGLVMLRVSDTGSALLSNYGAIYEVELGESETYIVDTGHLVAFDESVQYRVKKVGGLKSTLLSGEGLVCEFTGPGNVMIQTRSEDSFLAWLIPHLPIGSGE
ncbi:MAG: TIGR00266 family protein [Candidatus Poribacteria bacterium]|nr:TIGR00266 family protein [Candidatus Poribacteria bacterium]